MEKIVRMRSLYRNIHRSFTTAAAAAAAANHHLRRGFLPSPLPPLLNRLSSEIRSPLATTISVGSVRSFSSGDGMSHMPAIEDAEIASVFKDLMAASWDELPDEVLHDATATLSKKTEDEVGQSILANVLRAAEAVEEFSGKLVTLRMAIDDTLGMSGENVKPLPPLLAQALLTALQRYNAYLEAFGPDEAFLRKKVENELGTRMIHLKMRCANLNSEWGKVTVLGTSGLSGSYVEQRAK